MNWFAVGSKNEVKIRAVRVALTKVLTTDVDLFAVSGYRVKSGEDEQPMGLDAIFRGARRRAMEARTKSKRSGKSGVHIGIGVESGVIWMDEELPTEQNVCLDVCACAFAVENEGGLQMAYGLSGGFAVPHEVAGLLSSKVTLAEAAKRAGLTKKNKLGSAEGLIGVLSDGRIDRFDQTKQAVDMALVQAIPLLRKIL